MATTTQIHQPWAPIGAGIEKAIDLGTTAVGKTPPTSALGLPQQAGLDKFTQQAQDLAASQLGLGSFTRDPTTGAVTDIAAGTGVAGYAPYLTGAGSQVGAAQLTGTGAGTGVGSLSTYMSPYTTNVIQAMKDQMADVKAQQDIQRNAQAVGAGAFGGARQGVQQAVADTEYNRMIGQMVAQQTGQAFNQAQMARQQDYGNLTGLAQLQPQLAMGNVQNIAQLGQQEQAYRQALQDTTAAQQKMALYEPYQRYGFFGEQLTGLMGGYPGGTRMTDQPTASPMQNLLGMGIGAGLGYAGMKNLGMFGG